MATNELDRASAANEPSYLLLLASPFETPESVQEIFDIEAGKKSLKTHSLQVVRNEGLLSEHFGTSGEAVILDKVHAAQIIEYANRHRAIYSPKIVLLDDAQLAEAVIDSMGLSFPLWLFNADNERRQAPKEAHLNTRPAKLTGWRRMHRDNDGYLTLSRLGKKSYLLDSKAKLRPAQSVLDRLRFDESYNEADYRVVYQDRFEGEISLDLSQWAADTTEEDFIPQHRILRFERKWDGVPVWDRKSRVDILMDTKEREEWQVSGSANSVDSIEELSRLLQVSGSASDLPRALSKVHFEFTDNPRSLVKGIIVNEDTPPN